MTSVAPHPFVDWPGPIAFAHRGGSSEAPENTMAAFENAINLGYTYLETDVHATADGVLVAFHDPDLARTCARPGRIDELPWREVAAARVNGEAPIPTLEEVLGTWPHARVNIDCKADGAVDALVAALRRTNAYNRVCIAAADDRRIARIRARVDRALCTSLGRVGIARLRFAAASFRRSPLGVAAQVPQRLGPVQVVTPALVRAAHRLGMHVHVWTVDDAADMHRLLDLGVDGIMTDRPRVLRAVLQARDAWPSPSGPLPR